MAATNSIAHLKIGSTTYTLDPNYLAGIEASQYALDSDLTALEDRLTGKIAKGVRYLGELTTNTFRITSCEVGDMYIWNDINDWSDPVGESDFNRGDFLICHTACSNLEIDNPSFLLNYFDIIQGNIELDVLDKTYASNTVFAEHFHDGSTSQVSYTPAGTISAPTFKGTAASHKHTAKTGTHTHTFTGASVTPTGSFTGSSTTFTGKFTPSGSNGSTSITPSGTVGLTAKSGCTTISTDTEGYTHFTNTPTASEQTTHTHSFSGSASYTPAGTVSIAVDGSGTTNYTPAGSVGSGGGHSHTGKVSIEYTPVGTVAEDGAHTHTFSGSVDYTPVGSVGSHTHTVSSDTTSVSGTGALKTATLSGSYTSSTKTLELSNSTTTVSNVTVVSSVTGTSGATTPTFTGTKATIKHSGSTGSAGAHDHAFTGTKTTLTDTNLEISTAAAHTHTFTGTGTCLAAAFSGTQATISHSGTTGAGGKHTHTISANDYAFKLNFTGTSASHSHGFTGTEGTVSVSGTPKGSIAIDAISTGGTVGTAAEMTVTVENTAVTPAGTVSAPKFTGTAAVHSHSLTTSTYVKTAGGGRE